MGWCKTNPRAKNHRNSKRYGRSWRRVCKSEVEILVYTFASVDIYIQVLHLMHPRTPWGTGGGGVWTPLKIKSSINVHSN